MLRQSSTNRVDSGFWACGQMSKFHPILSVLFLFCPSLTSAQFCQDSSDHQQFRYEFADTSRRRSPIRVVGHLQLEVNSPQNIDCYSHEVEASIANESKKPIALFSVRFETEGGPVPGLDYFYQEDSFFTEDTFVPGASRIVHLRPLRMKPPLINGVPLTLSVDSSAPLKATARVEFVQFLDGSKWGDLEAESEMLQHRSDALRYLKGLERIYSGQGEEAFEEALSQPTNFPCMDQLKSTCQQSGNYAECTLQAVRRKLRWAADHHMLTRP